jgi:hypothetical protein
MKKTAVIPTLLCVTALVACGWIAIKQRKPVSEQPQSRPTAVVAPSIKPSPKSGEPVVATLPVADNHDEPAGTLSQAASREALYRFSGPTSGQPLAPDSPEFLQARLEGLKPQGRITPLDRESLGGIRTIRPGARILLPLAEGETVAAVVKRVTNDEGTIRIGGALVGEDEGNFILNHHGNQVSGMIQRLKRGLAYRVDPLETGELILREMLLSEAICVQMPRVKDTRPPAPPNQSLVIPILNSRPTAIAQLYLDFDGETVTELVWNFGFPIIAEPFDLSSTEITQIFHRVAEDFRPFDINVTTDVARYNSSPVGRRMRCIITPTQDWVGGDPIGGIAAISSFSLAGILFSNTVPCWAFNAGTVDIAETVSHELGHTLGLLHDGREIPGTGHEEYFAGHGTGADPNTKRWAPIMGAGFAAEVVQWSKGEYQFANNTQDDLAIILGNGFGNATDEAGSAAATAGELNAPAGNVTQDGAITSATDFDVFSFNTTGGVAIVFADNAANSPNLDISLTLLDSSYNVVAASSPSPSLDASIIASLPAGAYYLQIYGVGAFDPFTTGYSDYGSIGAYTLTGTIPGSVGSFTYVDRTYTGALQLGTAAAPFVTMAQAVSAAPNNSNVRIFGGHYPPALATGKKLRLERWIRPAEPSDIVTIGQ